MVLNKLFLKATGYTREELVLGGLVMGGLGVFGAVAGSVPWSSMLASDQEQAAALYRQIESANLKFFQEYGYWPHEVTDGTALSNVAVLVDRSAATGLYISKARYRPLLEADTDIVGGKPVVKHRYGRGGMVREVPLDNESKYRYVIVMNDLSMKDARELDQVVDGSFNPEDGRLQVTYKDGKAVARYYANPRSGGDVASAR